VPSPERLKLNTAHAGYSGWDVGDTVILTVDSGFGFMVYGTYHTRVWVDEVTDLVPDDYRVAVAFESGLRLGVDAYSAVELYEGSSAIGAGSLIGPRVVRLKPSGLLPPIQFGKRTSGVRRYVLPPRWQRVGLRA